MAPAIELPDGAEAADLGPVAEAIAVLDRIFWEQLPAMEIGALLQEVNPIGGPEKAKAVTDSPGANQTVNERNGYAGDSRTDVPAFEAVRAGGGLAISINGSREPRAQRRRSNRARPTAPGPSPCSWPLSSCGARKACWRWACPETPDKSRCLVLPEAVIEPIARGLEGRLFNLYDQVPKTWTRWWKKARQCGPNSGVRRAIAARGNFLVSTSN